jgi:Zn-dependent metalloprotease
MTSRCVHAGQRASHPVFCTILPPHILKHIAAHGEPGHKEWAIATLAVTERLRGRRHAFGYFQPAAGVEEKRRTIFDAGHKERLSGKRIRGEGEPKSKDPAVNQAYDGLGTTFDFYAQLFERNSVDDKGLRLDAFVHYGVDYDNAFWNGNQMVFGDGDGKMFQNFTGCLDVIAHELTHGVTQYEADLEYHDQPGALNESMSDVFGVLVKQWKRKDSADKADWLIGKGILSKGMHGRALRSMKDPGSAYDDPALGGKDPQPGHMKQFIKTKDDDGGVHLNSGIPNRAFYLAAAAFGGYAWDKAGPIWYRALTTSLRPRSQFKDAARATIAAARDLFGAAAEKKVEAAWSEVGVI